MKKILIVCCIVCFTIQSSIAQALYEIPTNRETRLSSFENPNGIKGSVGKTNKTAKGNAFEMVQPGETKTLLDINGEGTVRRIWMTVNISPVMLRSLRLQMFWEGEEKPAVDVPIGDFSYIIWVKQFHFKPRFLRVSKAVRLIVMCPCHLKNMHVL
ncbi:hypothetical protein BH10BAC3_BH10BAC3_24570 [soil metagenome]